MSNAVDAKGVLNMFADLNSRQQKNAHRNALKKGSTILVKQAKSNLKGVVKNPKSKNRWNGKTFDSGIKYRVDRNADEAKIHILGDFRLKFFELGTQVRHKRNRKRSSTGKIKAYYFFKNAMNQKQGEISKSFDNILEEAIQKVNAKYRNR